MNKIDKNKKKIIAIISGIILIAIIVFLLWFFNRKFDVTFDLNNGTKEEVIKVKYKKTINEKDIKKGLESLKSVPGRLNSIHLANGATAIIDFAHTPDGVEKVLTALSNMPFKRIITVVGCGGNRDKSKRPQMGKIAEDLSDFVVLTSDNPRFENPELIIDDIEFGMRKSTHTRFADRTIAVHHAIEISRSGDAIAILGKGAEEYQDINGVKSPYNDFEVVRDIDEEMRLEKAILGGQI